MARIKGKAVLITGGAHGIGRTTCSLLAREGASVAVTDVLDEPGLALVKEIRRDGGHVRYWHLDVSNERNVRVVVDEVHEAFGRIDVLINNPGNGGMPPEGEITGDEWDRVMAVNVKGAFLCTRAVVPWMRKNGGGSIVHLSSPPALADPLDASWLHATQGALRSMAQNDAALYARDRIRVNSVHPAFIRTPVSESVAGGSSSDRARGKKAPEALPPNGHVGDPEDVAYAILYLVSDESKCVTGSELVIDGGCTARHLP